MMKTKGVAGRAEDIVFQIGASKAIRNVINNALEFFTSRAADEAKRSIINTVGQKLEFYREKVGLRLKEMGIPLKAVETVRGRPFKDWLAADVALTIAELQAIQDGMATIGETYLDEEPEAETEQPRPQARPASVSDALDQFAGQGEVTATEATPSRQVSPTPEPPNDDVRAAYERGKLDKVKGASRRAVPGEWRTPEMSKLALAWESGWDGAA
jgi:hypothetical protein